MTAVAPSPAATRDRFTTLVAAGIIDDPWLDGAERLSLEPEILDQRQVAAIAGAAAAVAMVLDEAVREVTARDDLRRALGIDDSLAAVARLDAPRWLGCARADVFMVEGGAAPQVCELNCDTPTGLAECTELARLAVTEHRGLSDPSARLRERWLAMVRSCGAADTAAPVVGIIDPTEMTEDLAHVRLLSRWLGDAGFTVVRGSPFNLHACGAQRVGMFGTACDVLIRQYKCDWWARRTSLRRDEPPPPDARSLERELALIGAAQAAGTVSVINPWGAAIAQNKRVLALPWECPGLFSEASMHAALRHVPETRFLESVPTAQLIAERERWVLKSDYGCEGDEVLIGSATAAAEWDAALRLAAPGRWIVQRAFTPQRDHAGRIANLGVFMIGGLPSGIYTRRSLMATDRGAQSCPTSARP